MLSQQGIKGHRQTTCRANPLSFMLFSRAFFLQTPTVTLDYSIAFFVTKAALLLKLGEILQRKQSGCAAKEPQ